MKKKDQKTTIEFDKKQYELLIRALQIAGSVYGIMSDFVSRDYKKEAEGLDDLESWILAHVGVFGMANIVEIFEGKNVLKDEVTNRYTDDLIEYEDWAFWDVFAHKLADREMARRYKAGDLEKMTEHQILDLHCSLEEKYEKELDQHGLERFEIKEG